MTNQATDGERRSATSERERKRKLSDARAREVGLDGVELIRRPAEIRFRKVGVLEHGTGQVRIAEHHASQVRTIEDRVSKVGVLKRTPPQRDAAEGDGVLE